MQPLATFYIAAQIIERVTELFSSIGDKPRNEKTPADINSRAIWLWIVASVMGVGMALWLHLAFFHAAGLMDANQTADFVFSGIALGGGTKPVHDILSYIQKASEKTGK